MEYRYVLLTSAKNEEANIGIAIESVLRQTILPVAWHIVDDGSTDQTATIVKVYADAHSFIRLHTTPPRSGRSFGSKDKALQGAYEFVRNIDFEFIGIQDGDIAPQSRRYYEVILDKFQNTPKLGIAGGYIYERQAGIWQCRKSNSEDSVAGGIQMFRRICFEQMGGFIPLEHGGSDWLTQINARASGWDVIAFPEEPVFHYRPTSSADGMLRGAFRSGLMDASFGSHPVFELLKCVNRCRSMSSVVENVLRMSGYLYWNLLRRKPLLKPKQVHDLREWQKAKMLRLLKV